MDQNNRNALTLWGQRSGQENETSFPSPILSQEGNECKEGIMDVTSREKEEETIWIIKFSDGQLRSYTGTKEGAEAAAREEAAGRRWQVV